MSSGGKDQTVGYRYYLGLHLALCAGPVDAILQVRAGDRAAWTGTQTGSGSLSINAPELFGGEAREGGLVGTLDVMMGEAAQTANAYLTAQQGTPQPAYRGILGLVWRGGMIAANNPYVKPWKVKARRILQGWQGGTAWYSAKASITLANGDQAANPAHIVYECLTNAEWGMGYSTGQIDAASFTAAADTFHGEGLGLCLAWTRQTSIEAFVQLVMDHAGAVCGQDRTTGLFVLRPIRGGYSVPALPLFDPSNVLALDSYQRAATFEATNELSVTFTDLATGKTGAVTVQNLAQINAQGGPVSASRAYPGLPTAELAQRIALRDLRSLSTPIARVKMRVNREAYAVLPGDMIRMTWTKLGIVDLALRVLTVDLGTLTDSAITIEAAEDVFGLPSTTYTAQQPSGWTDPAQPPVAVTARLVEEASWYELQRQLSAADLSVLPNDAGFLAIVAARPAAGSLNASAVTRFGASGPFAETDVVDFCPTATLAGALGPAATSATITAEVDLDLVAAGGYAIIGGVEVVRIDTINITTGAVTLGRGVLDTVAASHAAGARVLFASGYVSSDGIERVDGDLVQAKLLTRTGLGTLAESSAPTDAVTFDQRHYRPYPPGQFRLNGQAYPAALTGTLTVSWRHRDRTVQNLEGDESGNIGPETGVKYEIRIYDHGMNTLLQTHGNLNTTSHILAAIASPYTLRVELWSDRSGIASRQKHVHVFTYTP